MKREWWEKREDRKNDNRDFIIGKGRGLFSWNKFDERNKKFENEWG